MSVHIYDAVRTPRGKARPDGTLALFKPQDLVAGLVDALEQRVGDVRRRADTLALGCVGQIGAQGGNIALVTKFRAGLPDATSAYTLNNYCVSGLSAVAQAAAAISAGTADFALAGGVESMSRVPFMGVAADILAMDRNLSRDALDAVTLTSHQRAAAAEADDALNRSRIPVYAADGSVALARDEGVRASTTQQSLAAMQPAFGEVANAYRAVLGDRPIDHRHTIANAPPITDGAALAFVGARNGGKPRARILSYAESGGDPQASLTAGFAAMDTALARAGMSLKDIGRIEFMEAFAVTIALFLRDRAVDPARVNVAGGHLAKGHPLGASGAILLSSLLDALEAAGESTGLVVASGASGIGAAMVVERVS
jgi:acetyl-CoA C-acetyltransferase